ncbi:hypothetical protein FNQ90_07505 [Streptomyces alkaliphilus]|uniref:DUF732 domain-containing protein n=1 Tax=Streptomyces alkaliphilus TaxID=1472722 RepID=A0A7W3Y145_9ACTN|nr:hypothetical protein [Streptomyces alkaliphilus]MBB0243956.1 hypothetical protein [Streptomyces alkaliphilus]
MRGRCFRAGVVTVALATVTALGACGGSGGNADTTGAAAAERSTGATPTAGDDPAAGDPDPIEENPEGTGVTGDTGDADEGGKGQGERDGKGDDRKGPAPEPDDGAEDAPSMGRIGQPAPDQAPAVEDRPFSAEEREYLDGRVPRGADPAPILQAGLETCQRLGYLSRHDPEGAVEALREGEIPGAEEAVPTLCPEHRDLLDRSRR